MYDNFWSRMMWVLKVNERLENFKVNYFRKIVVKFENFKFDFQGMKIFWKFLFFFQKKKNYFEALRKILKLQKIRKNRKFSNFLKNSLICQFQLLSFKLTTSTSLFSQTITAKHCCSHSRFLRIMPDDFGAFHPFIIAQHSKVYMWE